MRAKPRMGFFKISTDIFNNDIKKMMYATFNRYEFPTNTSVLHFSPDFGGKNIKYFILQSWNYTHKTEYLYE